MKGRYYYQSSFLNVEMRHNPSFTWQSILWGCELFMCGTRWRICTVQRMRIKKDPWLVSRFHRTPLWVIESLKLIMFRLF